MLSPDCVAYVVLKVISTRHDGSADVLDTVLDVTEVLRTELVEVEDLGSVVDAEVRTELDEVEDPEVCTELDEVEDAGVCTKPEEVDDAGSAVDSGSFTTVPMVVVYVVSRALTGTTKVSTVVYVRVTVSFVLVQSMGTYDVEVNVEG